MAKESLPAPSRIRVGLISLGCAKNLVDAEIMLGALIENGIEITNEPARADAVIINTCSFIDSAQEESIDAILESGAFRDANARGQALVVSGCLPQRFRNELPALLSEVDAFMGIDQVAQVTQIVRDALARRSEKLKQPRARRKPKRTQASQELAALSSATNSNPAADMESQSEPDRTNSAHPAALAAASQSPHSTLISVHARPSYIPDYATPRFRLTARHFAYLKIAEGCNHPCSFCTIPRMRGPHRSRSQNDIVLEARQLIEDGVREINLISQDSTYYGLDLRQKREGSIAAPARFQQATLRLPPGATTLSTLLRALNDLNGDFWIRLLYTHPAHWTKELIQTLQDCPKVVPYVDMPLQHIHSVMLERMRRETSPEYIEELIAQLRAGLPQVTLRTTFIVGFPGETDEYFQTLLEFIGRTRFERMGVFTYSREEGTRAGQMQGQIPDALKKKRRDQAMALQRKIARQIACSCLGKELRVLTEKKTAATELETAPLKSWEHGWLRRPASESALVPGDYTMARSSADAPDIDGRVYIRGLVTLGQFQRVKVIGHTDYDLIAEPLSD